MSTALATSSEESENNPAPDKRMQSDATKPRRWCEALVDMNSESGVVKCSQCGEKHDLIDMEVAFGMPDDYFGLEEDERNSRGKITSDFCQLDDRYFVRSVIPIPVLDRTEIYCWGIWVELSKDDFEKTYNTWEDADVSHVPKLMGKLANDLHEYENIIGIEGELQLKADSRPFFYITKESALRSDQTDGITVDDTARYYHYIA